MYITPTPTFHPHNCLQNRLGLDHDGPLFPKELRVGPLGRVRQSAMVLVLYIALAIMFQHFNVQNVFFPLGKTHTSLFFNILF